MKCGTAFRGEPSGDSCSSATEQKKFITICDHMGIIECEILEATYRRFGLATVQFAVVEVEGTVTAFDNGLGCTLDVQRVAKPRGWRGP